MRVQAEEGERRLGAIDGPLWVVTTGMDPTMMRSANVGFRSRSSPRANRHLERMCPCQWM
jgi:hypothetical protein